MKSFLITVLLGIAILWGGSMFSKELESVTHSLSEKNKALYEALEEKDQHSASKLLTDARDEFDKYKVFLEATSDHEELLRIELEYAAIKDFIREDQFGDALAACSEIELLINHLPSNFEVKAENIL